MKAILTLIALAIIGTAIADAAPISKADQIATIEHLRRNAKEAQADVLVAKAETKALQFTLDNQNKQIDTLNKKVSTVTVSRDYWKKVAERLLFALSFAAGLLAGLVFFQFSTAIITRIYPPALPFSILISVGGGVATFGSTWAALVHL